MCEEKHTHTHTQDSTQERTHSFKTEKSSFFSLTLIVTSQEPVPKCSFLPKVSVKSDIKLMFNTINVADIIFFFFLVRLCDQISLN